MRHVFVFAAVAAMPLIGFGPGVQPEPAPPDGRVQRTLHFAAGAVARSLEIDTVWGAITVTAHDRDTVDVVATRVVEARTADARAAADREVRLDITEDVADVRLYVDGPFRDCDHEGRRRSWRNPGYEVRYDFEVRVPRGVRLRLRTVNDGDITLQGTSGGFDVGNVNGGVSLRDVEGAGEASTINGDLTVGYRSNPRGDVRLKTLNGELVVRFREALSADLWLKTFNGEVYTDFDFTMLPSAPPESERRGGARVWKTSPRTGVRIGAGGTSVSLETFNGDIRILRSQS